MSNEIQQIIMYRDPVEAPVGEREAVSRAICSACEEGPDHPGCEPGNKYRWQDYLSVADAAISAYQRAQQPSAGVVMPERKDESKYCGIGLVAARHWNACLDEFARLNGKEVV